MNSLAQYKNLYAVPKEGFDAFIKHKTGSFPNVKSLKVNQLNFNDGKRITPQHLGPNGFPAAGRNDIGESISRIDVNNGSFESPPKRRRRHEQDSSRNQNNSGQDTTQPDVPNNSMNEEVNPQEDPELRTQLDSARERLDDENEYQEVMNYLLKSPEKNQASSLGSLRLSSDQSSLIQDTPQAQRERVPINLERITSHFQDRVDDLNNSENEVISSSPISQGLNPLRARVDETTDSANNIPTILSENNSNVYDNNTSRYSNPYKEAESIKSPYIPPVLPEKNRLNARNDLTVLPQFQTSTPSARNRPVANIDNDDYGSPIAKFNPNHQFNMTNATSPRTPLNQTGMRDLTASVKSKSAFKKPESLLKTTLRNTAKGMTKVEDGINSFSDRIENLTAQLRENIENDERARKLKEEHEERGRKLKEGNHPKIVIHKPPASPKKTPSPKKKTPPKHRSPNIVVTKPSPKKKSPKGGNLQKFPLRKGPPGQRLTPVETRARRKMNNPVSTRTRSNKQK